MTWQAVANKDFQDAIRSRWLWGLSVLFVVLIAGSAYFFTRGDSQDVTTDSFIGIFGQIGGLLIPLVAIVVAYAAIIGERESGTIKLLLSLPHSRQDVVLGKFLGRSAVIALPVLLGFAIAAVVFLVAGITFKFANFLAFTVLTTSLGVVFVGIAIGFSAGAPSQRRAMIGSVGVYVLFTLFWQYLRRGVINILTEAGKRIPGLSEPANATLVKASLLSKFLNPVRAYETLAATLYAQDTIGARLYGTSNPILAQLARQQLQQDMPFYLSDPFIIAVLVVWLVVPPIVGYLLFTDTDLT